jgi:hypothetical protein
VFHVSLLEPHYTHAGIAPPLEPVIIEGEPEYIIEDIMKDQTYQKRKEYLIQWKGWPIEEVTWEPEELVKDTATLEKYLQKRPIKLPGKQKRRQPSKPKGN